MASVGSCIALMAMRLVSSHDSFSWSGMAFHGSALSSAIARATCSTMFTVETPLAEPGWLGVPLWNFVPFIDDDFEPQSNQKFAQNFIGDVMGNLGIAH